LGQRTLVFKDRGLTEQRPNNLYITEEIDYVSYLLKTQSYFRENKFLRKRSTCYT